MHISTKELAEQLGKIAATDFAWHPHQGQILSEAARRLEALRPEEGLRVPEGWKLVPVEPTKEMLRAGDGITSRVGDGPERKIQYPPAVGPEDVYGFMLDAAPQYGKNS